MPKKSRAAETKRRGLTSEQLRSVTSKHIRQALRYLKDNPKKHEFGTPTKYYVDTNEGVYLPPKAVFGRAASKALDTKIGPYHFSTTEILPALEKAGCSIIRKQDVRQKDQTGEILACFESKEGRKVLEKHTKRERDPKIIREKKKQFMKENNGKLSCEICKMNPLKQYGEHGNACIEVHHKVPLAKLPSKGGRTTLEDLMCVCANCHRILHFRELRS